MNDSSVTLLNALVGLSDRQREVLSHLHFQGGNPPTVACFDFGDRLIASGPIASSPPIDAQIDQVGTSGLFGTPTRDGQTVRLHAGTDTERSAWETRIERAVRESAWALLEQAGAFRLAQWRRDLEMSRLQELIRTSVASGIPRRAVAEIADVA